MDLKLIQSKINLIRAQLAQLTDSGLFSSSEIERLSKSYQEQLDKWEAEMDRYAGDLDVKESETMS